MCVGGCWEPGVARLAPCLASNRCGGKGCRQREQGAQRWCQRSSGGQPVWAETCGRAQACGQRVGRGGGGGAPAWRRGCGRWGACRAGSDARRRLRGGRGPQAGAGKSGLAWLFSSVFLGHAASSSFLCVLGKFLPLPAVPARCGPARGLPREQGKQPSQPLGRAGRAGQSAAPRP